MRSDDGSWTREIRASSSHNPEANILCLKVLGSLLKGLESLAMDCNNSLGVYSRGSCLLRKSLPEPRHLGQSSLPVPVCLPRPQQSASENSGLDLLPRASM